MRDFKILTLSDHTGLKQAELVTVAVQTVAQALSGLFGQSAKDIANNKFIDALVQSAYAMGFRGFTHDDVVHLMPGNWGTDQTTAANVFNSYLQHWKTFPIGSNIVPQTNFGMGSGIWGGGYQPGHPITYSPNNVTNAPVNSTTGQIQKNSINPNQSSIFSNPIAVIIGIGLIFGLMNNKRK